MTVPLQLTKFKIKLPPRETPELDEFYNVVFDQLHASWAGGHHRAYEDVLHEYYKTKQDGFVYVFERLNRWSMSVDTDCVGSKEERELIPELTYQQLSKILIKKRE